MCVAVVTYNSVRDIGPCLSALEAHCPAGLHMIVKVVDNASTDGTSAEVQRHAGVDLASSTTNDGFAVSTNRSIRGANTDWILILNPDTQLRDGVLEKLLDVMSTDPEIGVVGCRLELDDGTLDHACKRAFPSPSSAARYFVDKALGKRTTSAYLAQDVDERGAGEVDAINGAFMLIRRQALDEVGLLDEGYWMYGEDLDWCRRFKLAGWKVHYEGTVTAVHLKGASSGRYRELRVDWHFHRSMWRFYRKFEGGNNVALDSIVCVGIGAHFVLSASVSIVQRARVRSRRVTKHLISSAPR